MGGRALPKGSLPDSVVMDAYEALKVAPLHDQRGDEKECGQGELCERLRLGLLVVDAGHKHKSLGDGASSEGTLGLWRALWSAAWAPLLGAFSAGAHRAAETECLHELALRGLQIGCQTAAMLDETEQAQAFSMALQQLAS